MLDVTALDVALGSTDHVLQVESCDHILWRTEGFHLLTNKVVGFRLRLELTAELSDRNPYFLADG